MNPTEIVTPKTDKAASLSFDLQISIIILGYNGRKYINNCLGSVLDQDFPAEEYEVIWADNASSDGSVEYIRRCFPRVRVLSFDTNLGFAEGNNRAARSASGRYLIFLNQDTIVHRRWLRSLVDAVRNREELVACQANMLMPWHKEFYNFDRVNYPSSVHVADISSYGYVEYREEAMPAAPVVPCRFLSGASFIIERRVADSLPHLFDPLFVTYSEDLDLSLRLKALGYRMGMATHAVVYHLQFSEVSNYRAALNKAYMSTRNRILGHYKALSVYQFIKFLPLLLWGSLIKVKQLRFGWGQEILMMLAMIPVSIAALIGAIRLMPLYQGYRKQMKSIRLSRLSPPNSPTC